MNYFPNMKFTTKFGLFALMCAMLFAAADARAVAGVAVNGTVNSINITDKQSTNLFSGVTITDGNTNLVTVFITMSPTSLGNFQSLPAGVVHTNNSYVIATTDTNTASTLISGLTFVPINNLIPVPNFSNVTFTVYATDPTGDQSTPSRTTTVRVTSTNDSPTLTVSQSSAFTINDNQTTKPFIYVSFTDVDNSGNQPVTVTVSLDNTNKGTINATNTGFTTNGSTLTFTGTDSAATTAIGNLVFIPTPNRVPVSQTETTTFTVQVTDTYATQSTSGITVTSTSVNDAPVVSGVTSTHQTVQTGHTLSPFSVLAFQDPDQNDSLALTNGQTLNWTVTLSGPAPLGNLELGGFNGTVYASSGDPKAASTDLRNLIYRAPSSPISTTNTLTLTITADDGHNGTLTTNVLIDLYSLVSPPGLTGTVSGQRVNDNTTTALFSGVTIQSHNGSSVVVRVGLSGVTNEAQGQLINLGVFV
jgi:hypothetical protein